MNRERALAVGMSGFALVIVTTVLYFKGPRGGGWFPTCAFHRITGLECPGCGMTRAVHAALHGRWADAFHFNPAGMLILPVLMILLGSQIPAWVRGMPRPWTLAFGRRGALLTLALVFGYWILRNTRAWPFPIPGQQ